MNVLRIAPELVDVELPADEKKPYKKAIEQQGLDFLSNPRFQVPERNIVLSRVRVPEVYIYNPENTTYILEDVFLQYSIGYGFNSKSILLDGADIGNISTESVLEDLNTGVHNLTIVAANDDGVNSSTAIFTIKEPEFVHLLSIKPRNDTFIQAGTEIEIIFNTTPSFISYSWDNDVPMNISGIGESFKTILPSGYELHHLYILTGHQNISYQISYNFTWYQIPPYIHTTEEVTTTVNKNPGFDFLTCALVLYIILRKRT
ncbi:MAG: hypothetical protein ACTSP4_17240 [Candidatus Hodarchaeales archaeon]